MRPKRTLVRTGDESSADAATLNRQSVDPELQKAVGRKYRLFEGTILECVLTNRLDGSFSGPVNVMLTTTVYTHDGRFVLDPARNPNSRRGSAGQLVRPAAARGRSFTA